MTNTNSSQSHEYDFHRIAAQLKLSDFTCDTAATNRPSFYALGMFPYPSGNAHMGHVRVYTISDVRARFERLQGKEVLHPIGWDAFGLPAENAAIQNKTDPASWTQLNIERMKNEQFKSMGWSFDLSKELSTCSPDYYRWTQWIFLQFYKHGKAYRSKGLVNWCPVDETVLANEQVIEGRCWRDGAVVEKRQMEQWFLRITDYAERLWNDIEKLKNWPNEAVAVQKNWINQSHGTEIDFTLDTTLGLAGLANRKIRVFTTRADTLFGVVALVVAPEHPLVANVLNETKNQSVQNYVDTSLRRTAVERMQSKEKTGLPLGIDATHPLTGQKVPVWIGDYVLGDYGTGAVMCVPAHDERDYEFAQKYDLPVVTVITPADGASQGQPGAFTADGVLTASQEFSGLDSASARKKITDTLVTRQAGTAKVNYNLRDWSVGRQRYWGCPIPIIYCDHCGTVPVPENQLPVLLPTNVQFVGGKADVKSDDAFVKTSCPTCQRPATRETDTLDTFMCSSWYAFRFIDPHNSEKVFDSTKVNQFMPIDFYVGGIEHAALHMIYFRFFTKFFNDIGLINFDEPVDQFFCNGMVRKEGSKMSKSKGNVVVPTDMVREYGSDALRLYILSDTPADLDFDWEDSGIPAKLTFVKRAYRVITQTLTQIQHLANGADTSTISAAAIVANARLEAWPNRDEIVAFYSNVQALEKQIQQSLLHNGVAKIHELANTLTELSQKALQLKTPETAAVWAKLAHDFVIVSSIFMPYFAEDLFQKFFKTDTVPFASGATWPVVDRVFMVSDNVTVVVQVNGKKRCELVVRKDTNQLAVEEIALKHESVKPFIDGKEIKKLIFVPNKIFNIVAV